MKGVILAGGTGSRLFPLTHTGPKQLLPVANQPVLEYAVKDMRRAGITDIAMVLGNKGREKIQSHFGDGSDFDVDISYIVQGEALGLAHAVGCTREFVGNDPFVVYLGDVMVEKGLKSLIEAFNPEEHVGCMGLKRVDDPSRYGIAELEDGEVTNLVEKPDNPPSNLAGVGLVILQPSIFEYIERLEPSWRGELELTEAINNFLTDGGTVVGAELDGWWIDTGTPEDIVRANGLVLSDITRHVDGDVHPDASVEGDVRINQGATVESGAEIVGPSVIASGAVIEAGSRIGPNTSIGPNTVVNARVANSIVQGECVISTEVEVRDSLLGEAVSISQSQEGTKFIVADDTEVEL